MGIKRAVVFEGKLNEGFPVGIVYYSSCFPLVIDGDLNMGDMSGGNCSMKNHIISINSIVIQIMVM